MPKKKVPKTTRAPRGAGSVYPDKRRGGWIGKAIVGYEVGKGNKRKPIYKYFHGDTQAEVVALKAAAKPPGPKTTVSEWADRWLASVDVRAQTFVSYRQTVNLRVKPVLGALALAKVTAFDVEQAAKVWGKEVAANTVRKHLNHLGVIFKAAGRANLVPQSPVTLARRPAGTKVDIDPFTVSELAQIVRAAVAEPEWRILAVLAATGLRIGEGIGLEEGDYDTATGKLTVARTATNQHGNGPPKSVHSARVITVPRAARPALVAGITQVGFTATRARFGRLLASLGIRYRNPHQLRHSVASHAIAARVPIANVARDLGDTVQTVVDTYLHPTAGADVCSAMDAIFEGPLGGAEVADKVKKGKNRQGKPAKVQKRS